MILAHRNRLVANTKFDFQDFRFVNNDDFRKLLILESFFQKTPLSIFSILTSIEVDCTRTLFVAFWWAKSLRNALTVGKRNHDFRQKIR